MQDEERVTSIGSKPQLAFQLCNAECPVSEARVLRLLLVEWLILSSIVLATGVHYCFHFEQYIEILVPILSSHHGDPVTIFITFTEHSIRIIDCDDMTDSSGRAELAPGSQCGTVSP